MTQALQNATPPLHHEDLCAAAPKELKLGPCVYRGDDRDKLLAIFQEYKMDVENTIKLMNVCGQRYGYCLRDK